MTFVKIEISLIPGETSSSVATFYKMNNSVTR